MKGKFKIICAILFLAVAITAGIFVGVNQKNKIEWIEAVDNWDNDFSFVDENGIILSVEKVGIKTSSNPNEEDFKTPLYTSSLHNEQTKKMLVRDNDGEANGLDAYYFVDLPNQESSNKNPNKYVVKNGEYVKLNNTKKGSEDSLYFSDKIPDRYNEAGEKVEMAEAIAVSLGQYFNYTYVDEEVSPEPQNGVGLAGQTKYVYNGITTEEKNSGAKLTYIEISAYHNEQKMSGLPPLRNYGEGYRDFVYIIPQKDGYDGFYEFFFNYIYNNGQTTLISFSFNLLFDTDYVGKASDGNEADNYNLQPTLTNVDSGNNFYLGKSEAKFNNYPTLTFDYTRYGFSYSLLANGKTIDYRYVYSTNGNENSKTAMYNCFVNDSQQPISYPMGNFVLKGANIAVFVFTEMGDYTFNFEYLDPNNKDISPGDVPEMNLSVDSINLSIHGYEINYSATTSAKAQMRHLTLAKPEPASGYKDKINVGLIVPNGYEYGKMTSSSNLGVVYTLSEEKKTVGSLISYEGADKLGWENTLTSNSVNLEDYVKDGTDFVRTNQGAILLSSNDKFAIDGETNSFYYYATTKDGLKSSPQIPYSNQTAFNDIGFYLVFIRVDVNGSAEGKDDYYQIFAFEYTADTTNIDVNEVDADGNVGEIIGSDGYTNKNVKIHWQEPGVFERKITVKYYTVLGEYYSKEQLLETEGTEIKNDAILGSDIDKLTTGSKGAKYLLELVCENKSAIYRTFTIDRDPITGIKPYLVARGTNLIGNTIYNFATNSNGELISLENEIVTDSVATLFWDNKKSGAGVSATYSLTPFVYKNVDVAEVNYSNASGVWYTTKYALGDTVDDLKFERASELGAGLDKQKIITTQGIYLFTLTDQAGNSVKYLFVIDQTEGYFKIEEKQEDNSFSNAQFYTGDSLLFTKDVRLSVGTHKAINLETIANESLNSFVSDVSNSSPLHKDIEGNYYSRDSVYRSALRRLFVQLNGNYYLTVQNRYLHVYDDTKTHVQTLNLQSNRSSVLSHGEGASTVRIIYLVGENQTYLKNYTQQTAASHYAQISSSDTYLMLEINTDHSLGMAFYANSADILTPDSVSNSGAPSQGLTRLLYTGSAGKEFDGMHATDESYLAFTWLIGTGTSYEIGEVSYAYYELDLTGVEEQYKAEFGLGTGYFYFTNKSNNKQTLYADSKYSAGVVNNGTRAMAILNVENSETKPGLYAITRKYSNEIEGIEGEEDSTELTYYFIVDRNEIIATGTGELNINGGSISVGLKDNEVKYNQFNRFGSSAQGNLNYIDDSTGENINLPYNIYFETNRLPAVLNIPVGKYFYEENGVGYGSEYYAGKLNFSVYFKDVYAQLPSNYYVVKLFESNVNSDDKNYYQINIASQISNNLRARFIYTDSETGVSNQNYWLCLPGDYIVVISDNLEGVQHQKIIGFSVYGNQESSPTTDIYATHDKNSQTNLNLSNNSTKTLVTSEEFVVVDLFNDNLPQNLTKAQLDLDYLLVEQIYDGQRSTYIEYRHTSNGGHNIDSQDDISYILHEMDENGTVRRKILLDTLLNRNADGTINLQNIEKTLQYRVTIRYNVSGAEDEIDKYKNCYYYYDGNQVYPCFESVYTITIDRTPPKENVEALEAGDQLVEYYLNNEESLFEIKDYDNPDSLEFARVYKNYYKSLNSGDIYALYANANTPFNTDDINKIYYKAIVSLESLELSPPNVVDFSTSSGYIPTYVPATNSTYSALGLGAAGFYEIFEIDLAGNTTQYVIFYDDLENDYDNLNFNVNANVYDENSEEHIKTERRTLSISNNDLETLTIFDIFALEEDSFTNYKDVFYRFELTNSNGQPFVPAHAINTNFATLFNQNFAQRVIDEIIKAEGPGNYNLVLRSRTNTKIYNLNFYSNANIHLDVNAIIVSRGEGEDYEFLYLDFENAKHPENGIIYYAKEIHLIQGSTEVIYYCDTANFNYYYLVNTNGSLQRVYVLDNKIYKEALSGTYELVMIDVFDNESRTTFNTEDEQVHYIRFGGENESSNCYKYNGVYYSYNQARVIFENGLYTVRVSYSVNNGSWTNTNLQNAINYNGQKIIELINLGEGRSQVVIYPYFSSDLLTGANIHVIVTLVGVNGGSYEVVVDSNIASVSLMDINSVDKPLKADVNADPSTTSYLEQYGGIMNLIWNLPSKNWNLPSTNHDPYKYKFSLQETMLDNSVVTIEFENDVFSHIINTTQESSGVYRFVVDIYTNDEDELYLGNKVFTFYVQSSVDDLFYVSIGGNRTLQANSTFTFGEIASELNAYSQAIRDSLNVVYNTLIADPYEHPLYIVKVSEVNTALPQTTVQVADGTGLTKRSWHTTWAGNAYGFYIYRLSTETYSFYLGILEVEETDDLVYNLQVNDESLSTSLKLDFTYSENVEYTLRGRQTNLGGLTDNPIINKNSILISVHCNNGFIEQFETNSKAGGEFEYLIRGNGQYSFEFADLAGNVHSFTINTQNGTLQDSHLNIYILREVVLLVNGVNAVENAYYNTRVQIALLNPALYDTGTISLHSCTLNGEDYEPQLDFYNQIYTFSSYGSYKVEFHAYYKEQLLKKVLVFTIVNVNEVSSSFDLSNIFKYRVDTILNNAGEDITDNLISILKSNEGKNQYLLTYQTLLDNANLGTSYGKQTITIIYSVDDGIYPVRELRFAFTLNNKIPTIDCNVKAGDSTTKGFTITYNPWEIYQEVGESYLFINNILVEEIDETSIERDGSQTYTITYKGNGAGDYYVILSGSSGAVHTGFVVTVKEPLNASSIIIIIVVVLVVAIVVGVIIFLRTRMKIR